MKKKTIIGLIAVLAVALVVFFVFIKKGKADQPEYRTEVLAKGNVEAVVTTSGTINPIDIVEVGSQVSGKISKLYADFNTPVKAGQLMAELDRDIQNAKVDSNEANYQSSLAALEQAKVNLENAKKKNERTLDLFQRNLVSFEEKETAEANFVTARVSVQQREASVAQAKSTLNQSKVDLSYTTIRSPIDGTVIDRPVNAGQTVAASMNAPVLFKVASDLTKMKVQCSVDEADIGRVKEGQKVRFTVDAFQGETFNGTIMQVRYAAVTTQNVVTYTTIVDAPNPDLKLRPGMTATVTIITGEANGVLKIPNSSMRFTPSLPQEELEKLLATLRPQGQRNGQPGAAAGPGRRRGPASLRHPGRGPAPGRPASVRHEPADPRTAAALPADARRGRRPAAGRHGLGVGRAEPAQALYRPHGPDRQHLFRSHPQRAQGRHEDHRRRRRRDRDDRRPASSRASAAPAR